MFSVLRRLLTTALVAAALVGLPAGARPALAIAHGEDAADGAYPFSVLLTMTGLPADRGGTRDSSCSGALVAPRWVITAGHCFRTADGRPVSRLVAARTTATIGRTDLDSAAGHEVDVVAVRQAGHADVALAELAVPVTDITPLRLGTSPPVPGETVRLTGYGLTSDTGSTPTRRLQTGQFVVDRVGDAVLETAGHAPKRDTSPCRHDSGGPYFTERPGEDPALVAVVSAGPQCPHTGHDLSARTDDLRGWIAGTVAERDTGAGPGIIVAALLAAIVMTGVARRAGRVVSSGMVDRWDVPFCYLTTVGRNSGRNHTVEIWFAGHGDTVYLLSGGGDRADWVRNLRRQPRVTLQVGTARLAGRARIVTEPDEDRLARDLVAGKYQPTYAGDLTAWRETALPVAIDVAPEGGERA